MAMMLMTAGLGMQQKQFIVGEESMNWLAHLPFKYNCVGSKKFSRNKNGYNGLS